MTLRLGSPCVLAAIIMVAGITLALLWQRAPVEPRAAVPAHGPFPFGDYDALLRRYVDDQGRVDYQRLKERDSDSVERLYAALSVTGPERTPALYPDRDARLAYYISAYNLLVWKNVIDGLPQLHSVKEKFFRFFREPEFLVDGRALSLRELEDKIIRPRLRDPRLHFALNCASGGCPRLPREAFSPPHVQAQLERETRRFIGEGRNVAYDPVRKTVRLSPIFKWYAGDFGGAVLAFVNRYRAQPIPAGTRIEYGDYDWRLNDLSLPPR